MSRELIVGPGAESDIEEGYGWYEERQPGLGSRFIEELDTALQRLAANPASYQEVLPDIRRAITHTFPYLVFFTFDATAVHILAVVPAAQDPNVILSKLGQ